MGGLLSSLIGTGSNPNLDVPDPATGLTPREKNAVRRIWDIVKTNTKQNGIDLLMMWVKGIVLEVQIHKKNMNLTENT